MLNIFKKKNTKKPTVTITGTYTGDNHSADIVVTADNNATNKEFLSVLSDLTVKSFLNLVVFFNLDVDKALANFNSDVKRSYEEIQEGAKNDAK